MENIQNTNSQNNYGQPTVQPDYEFLNNYTAPTPPKKSKKPLIIGMMIVIAIVLVGIAALSGPSQTQPTTQKSVALESSTPTNAEATSIDSLIAAVRDNEPAAAYEIYIGDKSNPTEEAFKKLIYTPIQKRVDLNACGEITYDSAISSITKQKVFFASIRCGGVESYEDQLLVVSYVKDVETVKYRSMIAYDATATSE